MFQRQKKEDLLEVGLLERRDYQRDGFTFSKYEKLGAQISTY